MKSLIKHLTCQLEMSQVEIAKFTTRFADDPANALTWSDGTFYHAARAYIVEDMLTYMTQDDYPIDHESLLNICENQFAQAVRQIARVGQSTSAVSNLMDCAKAEVWQELLSTVKSYIDRQV